MLEHTCVPIYPVRVTTGCSRLVPPGVNMVNVVKGAVGLMLKGLELPCMVHIHVLRPWIDKMVDIFRNVVIRCVIDLI